MATTTTTSVSGSLLKRGARMARSLVARKCIQSETIDTCEKPAASANTIIGVLIGVGVLIFIIVMSVLFFLHRRRQKLDKAELANDPHELSDYGLDEIPATKKGASSNNLSPPTVQQKRLSAQELLDAQNPFGYGAELADSDRVSVSTTRKNSPPRYPDAAAKM
ncbi:hypothetical protein N0V82_002096 [Gnomoniopsis sp. IMI 355080]|nr:hypothetical protein N0V82_002096 [Gnomoniopsis sp. IMI 355080]